MDQYPKLFSKAALIYLALGVFLGIGLGGNPEWAHRLRFTHIHFNLLGFMVMMIAGVAYHVLPRFNARPVPWPEGVKYHFILQNVGLLGMCAAHIAGGFWNEGVWHVLFVIFAVITGAGLLIMVVNLYAVLSPTEATETAVRITGDMKVGEVLGRFPATLQIFLDNGFKTLSNPVARQTFGRVVTIEKACGKHGVDVEPFLAKLNASLNSPDSEVENPPDKSKTSPAGKSIERGELCTLDVRVGSLIKTYPETKAVFEKHYGEGCFSCPGQVYETVEQTADMHSIDPQIILREINAVIQS